MLTFSTTADATPPPGRGSVDTITTMLTALRRDPGDDTAWLALADSLAEAGQESRAELVRVQLALRQPVVEQEARLEARLHELWRLGVPPCQPTLSGPFGMEFILIPPGSFWMGAREDERWRGREDLPRRRVTLSRGFFLGATPVTWKQYTSLIPHYPNQIDTPVVEVRRSDAETFCSRLSDWLDGTCRLPTEAQWEYACRAGTTTLFCSGDTLEDLEQVGWCSLDGTWDSAESTQPVRSLRGNSWGLHDMHGNVWEWCRDWYDGDYYSVAPAVDPTGPADGENVCVRGGSFRGGPWFCRSAARRGVHPDSQEINLGFRVLIDL